MTDRKVHIESQHGHRVSDPETEASKQETKNEIRLWNEFREGSDAAFSRIYERFFPVLYSYGHQFTADTELIKDVIQDFFIKIRNNRGKLGKTTSIKAYFYKSVRRELLRILSRKNRMIYGYNLEKAFDFEIALSQESILINRQISGEQKLKLEKAFGTLTKRQKEAIIYHYYDGLTYEEIASIMGLSRVKYARTLIYRGIDKLKGKIALMTTVIMVLISFTIMVIKYLKIS